MTDPTPEVAALNERRDWFIDEESTEASTSWEVWHLSKEAGTADSEIVKGTYEEAESRIFELAGRRLGAYEGESQHHDDGYSGGFDADGYIDKDTGDIFYFYQAYRVHSWWEGVDQRLDEAGFPPDYLTDGMREFIHREIVRFTT